MLWLQPNIVWTSMGVHSPREHQAVLACPNMWDYVTHVGRSHVKSRPQTCGLHTSIQKSTVDACEITSWWLRSKEPHPGDTTPWRPPCVPSCAPWNLWDQPQRLGTAKGSRQKLEDCDVFLILVEKWLEKEIQNAWKMEETSILRCCIRKYGSVSSRWSTNDLLLNLAMENPCQ